MSIRSLVYFQLFDALNDAFELQFVRASSLQLIKDTDNM